MMIDNFAAKFAPVNINDKCATVNYYCRQFLRRTLQMFRYSVIPETIPKRDLELLYQVNGFAVHTRVSVKGGKGVIDLDNGEPYAFFGGLGGVLNAYYNPTKATVANPFLNLSVELHDGENCVIVYNDSTHEGLMPIFRRYATLLAENEISLRIADINARLITLLQSDNDVAKKSAEQYITKIEKGDLSVLASKAFYDGIKAIPYAATGSTNNITQLIELEQYLKAGVFNDIGLNANYNMKREAINSTEAQMGTDALLPLVDDMLYNRQYGHARVKELLGYDIECEFASAWEDRHDIADGKPNDEPEVDTTGETVEEPETDEKGESENADEERQID